VFGRVRKTRAHLPGKSAPKARGRQPILISIVLFGLGAQKVHFHINEPRMFLLVNLKLSSAFLKGVTVQVLALFMDDRFWDTTFCQRATAQSIRRAYAT
jgi:hypothetical protein